MCLQQYKSVGLNGLKRIVMEEGACRDILSVYLVHELTGGKAPLNIGKLEACMSQVLSRCSSWH